MHMKKSLCLILALLFAVTAAGCGKDEPSGVQSEENAPSSEALSDLPASEEALRDYSFDFNGVEIAMNAPTAPLLEALGEPVSYTEEPSCAFSGMDKTYFYGSFYFSTYTRDKVDYVSALWFADDSVTTEEGVYVGSTEEDVAAAYGEQNYTGKNSYVMTGKVSQLTILLEDGSVTSVRYDALDLPLAG